MARRFPAGLPCFLLTVPEGQVKERLTIHPSSSSWTRLSSAIFRLTRALNPTTMLVKGHHPSHAAQADTLHATLMAFLTVLSPRSQRGKSLARGNGRHRRRVPQGFASPS